MKKILLFVACIAVPLLLGAVASRATMPNIESWYGSLNAPSFKPPNWLFAPVWTILYVLIGVSFFLLITKQTKQNKTTAVSFAIVQMILNTAWSFMFFYYHQIALALINILILWVFILGMIRAFYPIHKTAALLQIPYLAWVSFATALNAAYLILNY